MPKYSCDYCSVYLSHDSAAGRKQHYRGKKHHENVKAYYEKLIAAGETGGVQPVSEHGTAIPTTLSGSTLPITGLVVIHPYVQPCMLYYRLPQWHAGMIARPPRAVPPGYQQVMHIATQLAKSQLARAPVPPPRTAAPVTAHQQHSPPPLHHPYAASQPPAVAAPMPHPGGPPSAHMQQHPHPAQPGAGMHPARLRALGLG